MNLEKLKNPYLLTFITFIIFTLIAALSIEVRNLLSIFVIAIITLVIHNVICKKLGMETDLNKYIKKVYNRFSSKELP